MKKIFYYVIPLLVFFSACQNEKKDLIGPEYQVAPVGFNLTSNFSSNLSNVNFATGDKQFFNAQFSERATWTITLKGQTSQAIKTITGLSDRIDENNSLWLGTHDELMFFRSGEDVEATLSILGFKDSYKLNFKITNARVYPGAKEMGSGFEGFEYNQLDWYYSPYPNKTVGGKVSSPVIEGNYAFKLSGVDDNNDYFIGSVRRTIPKNFLTSATKDFYVNVFVYGTGSNTSKLKVSLKHDSDSKFPYGVPQGYVDTEDDAYEYEVPLNFKGWQLVSIKYSSFTRTLDRDFGGSGPNTKDPSKLVFVDFALLTKTIGEKAEVVLDYPTITFDKAFMQ
ncbi:MAG: hypothetical protein J7604_19405 [Sporocytophaga sp.]|uniref:hypothetical protein n=1 Tax=Sporocytophaga sp. TaxID=2231183 RepID=UPI001AFD7A4E|nr:hypothetical protein [Sporocytophaga sp.]MBO9702386.1 hypothetical protein [Sporocytophaga sp.]